MGSTGAKQRPVDHTGHENPNFILKPGYDTVKTETTNIDTLKGTSSIMDPENGSMENSELAPTNIGHTETFITNEINEIYNKETLNNNTKDLSSLPDYNSTKQNAIYSDTTEIVLDSNIDMQEGDREIHQEAGIPKEENTKNSFIDNRIEHTRDDNLPEGRKGQMEDNKNQNDNIISTVFVTDESLQKLDSVLEQENSSNADTSGNEVPVIDVEMIISDDNVAELSEPMSSPSSKNGNSKKKSVSFDSPSPDAFSEDGTPVASLQSAGCKQLKYRYDTGSEVGICVDFDDEVDSVAAGQGNRHGHVELGNLVHEEQVDTMAKVRDWEGVKPQNVAAEENGIVQSMENGTDQCLQVTESICHTNEIEVQEMIIVEESKSAITETPNAEIQKYDLINDASERGSDNQGVVGEMLTDEVQVYTVIDTATGETKHIIKEPDKQTIIRKESMPSSYTARDPKNSVPENNQKPKDTTLSHSEKQEQTENVSRSQKVAENPEYIHRTIVEVRPDVMHILSPVKEEPMVKLYPSIDQQADTAPQSNFGSPEQTTPERSQIVGVQQNTKEGSNSNDKGVMRGRGQNEENEKESEEVPDQADFNNTVVEIMKKDETEENLVSSLNNKTELNCAPKAKNNENKLNNEPIAYKTVPLNDVYKGKISNKHAYAKPNPLYQEDEAGEDLDKSPKRKDKKDKKKISKKKETNKKINGSVQKKSSESIEIHEPSEAKENSLYSDDSVEMQGYDRLITKTTQQRRRRRICCMLGIVIFLALLVGGAGALLAVYLPQNESSN